ncbi:hypothetical protein ACFS7Z_13430 [Pontibacter toksunensis]|uniref:STAS/SEC14 domain-containing protein n=1 Tax=Pontibacter toksunensis TaxID=1332631 RepID=A0ABW6BU98_9BACT
MREATALVQVYSDENGKIECDREHRLVQLYWSTHCNGQPLRSLLLEALRHATSSQLTAWLCDMRKLHYMEMADQNWLINELFPSFSRRHRHRVAFVVNINNYELMSSIQTKSIVLHTPALARVIAMDVFLAKGEARHWLLSQTPSDNAPSF